MNMKIIALFPISLILILSACTERLDYELSNERLLQMNAFFDSADSVHKVLFYWSTGNGVIKPSTRDSICVSMYINGNLSDKSFLSNEDPCSAMLKGTFCEGDVIQLIARASMANVEAEISVPPAACISHVDTIVRDRKEYFDITVDDVKGENNYYGISIWKDWHAYVSEVYDESEYVYPGYFWGRWEEKVELSGEESPLLVSRFNLSPDVSEYNSDMKLFNDESFRNGHGVVRLKTEDPFIPYVNQWSSTFKVVSEMTVRVRLHSMDYDTYRYLEDVLFEESDYSFLMPFPTIYPSNVKGGLGFVGAFTSKDYELRFPSYCFLSGRLEDPTVIKE